MHDQPHRDRYKPKPMKTSLKKPSVYMVLYLFQVNFVSYLTVFLLRFMHRVNNFLENKGIIKIISSREKTPLVKTNKIIELRAKPINHDLCPL